MGKCRDSVPAACRICGKILNRVYDMKRHLLLHLPDEARQKYRCKWTGCSFSALQKSNLKTHMNTHLGLRPYKCPTMGCPFESADPGSLSRHRSTQHGRQPRANSRRQASGGSQRTTGQQQRGSPYTVPEGLPSSSRLRADDHVEDSNHMNAYGTEWIFGGVQGNDAYPAPASGRDGASFAWGSGSLATSVPQPSNLHVLQRGRDGAFDAAVQSVNDGVFGDFNTSFDGWPRVTLAYGGSSLPFPLVPHGVDTPVVSTPAFHPAAPYDIHDYTGNYGMVPTSAPLTHGLYDLPLPVVQNGGAEAAPARTPGSLFPAPYGMANAPMHYLPTPAPLSRPYVASSHAAHLPMAVTLPAYDARSGYTNVTASFGAQFDDDSLPDSFASGARVSRGVGAGEDLQPQPQPQLPAIHPRAAVDAYLGQDFEFQSDLSRGDGDTPTSDGFGMQDLYA